MSALQAITSRPWANLASYTDAEWHLMYQTLFDGSAERGPLLNSLNDFEVTASSPVAMTIEVNAGVGVVGGLWCQSTTSQTLDVAANGGGANRYDLVFLHWTRATQVVNLRIVDGTAVTCAVAAAPAANAIATYQVGGPPVTEWAVPLACITVTPAAAQILDANITDLREYCRFRTDATDLVDGATLDISTSQQIQIADGGVGIDQIAAALAGDALVGGAGAALDVNVDGVTVEIAGDVVQVAATCAGDGLGGGAGAALDVNVDAATIVIPVDTLEVGAIDNTNIDNRTRYIWIGANALHCPSGGAATWGALGGHPVAAEGWILPTGADTYVVGHCRIPDACTAVSHAVYFVFTHSYNGATSRYVTWEFQCITDRECADSLIGGITTRFTVNLNVNLTTEDERVCWNTNTGSGGGYTGTGGITFGPGEYVDFIIGREGLSFQDSLAESVVLLGLYIPYTADM